MGLVGAKNRFEARLGVMARVTDITGGPIMWGPEHHSLVVAFCFEEIKKPAKGF